LISISIKIKGLIVKVTATKHKDRVRITPFRRSANGKLRRAGGKWCDNTTFKNGIRLILNYNINNTNIPTANTTWSSQTIHHETIELIQQSLNVFVFTPPVQPSPPVSPVSLVSPVSPVPPVSPVSPVLAIPPIEEQLLEAEHISWYDDVVPVFSKSNPERFRVMNECREK
jgi:hypothetical protein